MNAKTINLQEWEAFGGGGFGTSYYNKTDDSVILKLNKPSISEDTARKEFLRSKAPLRHTLLPQWHEHQPHPPAGTLVHRQCRHTTIIRQ